MCTQSGNSSSVNSSGQSSSTSSNKSSSQSSSKSSSSSTGPRCNNGHLEAGEECDTGNPNDTCCINCVIQPNCQCVNVPVSSSSSGGDGSSSSGGNNGCPTSHPNCGIGTSTPSQPDSDIASCPSDQTLRWAGDEGVNVFAACRAPSGVSNGRCYRCAGGSSSSGGGNSNSSGGSTLLDCPFNQCTDTDGGDNPIVAGTVSRFVSGFWLVEPDYCATPSQLDENVCGGSSIQPCGTGHTCVNGFCATPAEAQAAEQKCKDSDGGYNLIVKGAVTTPSGTLTDRCVTYSGDNADPEWAFVEEWVCSGGVPVPEWTNNPCPNGCRDGACLASPGSVSTPESTWQSLCRDTDAGQDPTKKGTVTAPWFSGTDTCALPDGTTVAESYGVLEYSCVPGEGSVHYLPCPKGTKCTNGACTSAPGENPAPHCTEKDGGVDPSDQYGLVSINGVPTFTDECGNGPTSSFVIESYCAGTQACAFNGQDSTQNGEGIVVFLHCPNGCYHGACK